jgi:hypothetical protein
MGRRREDITKPYLPTDAVSEFLNASRCTVLFLVMISYHVVITEHVSTINYICFTIDLVHSRLFMSVFIHSHFITFFIQ